MTGPNSFPIIQRLFNSCRRAGVWARIVLETDGGLEGGLNRLYRLQTVKPARGEGQEGKEEAFQGKKGSGAEGSVAGEVKDCGGEGGS